MDRFLRIEIDATRLRTARVTIVASLVLGFATGSGIAGASFGSLVTPSALAAWYFTIFRASERSPGLSTWLLAHLAFGLAAAISTATWIPRAALELGGSRLSGVALLLVLAVWHGAVPVGTIGLLSFARRDRHAALTCGACCLATWIVELLVSRSGLFVPWVLIGHSQPSPSPLLPLATLGGVPSISAAVVALSASAGLLLERRRGSRAVATIVWCAAVAFAWLARAPDLDRGLPSALATRASSGSLEVMLVQPNFPRSGRWDPELQAAYAARIAAYTERAIEATDPKPDLVVWPETTVTIGSDPTDPTDRKSAFARFARDRGVMLIAGRAIPQSDAGDEGNEGEEAYRNVLLWHDRDGRTLDVVDKEVGVPGVEARLAIPQLEGVARLLLGPVYSAPKAIIRPAQGPLQAGFSITQAVCFEALFPSLVARRRRHDTRLLINPADDSWGHDIAVSRQLATLASFRAVEQHLPLARVAHGGLTLWYDELGRERGALRPRQYGSLRHPLGPVAPLAERRAIVARQIGASSSIGLLAAALLELALRAADRRWPRRWPGRL